MAGKNIFEIQQEYLALYNEIEENDGVLTEELMDELTIKQEELESKLKGYYYVIKTVDGQVETIDKEIERLNKIKKSKTNSIQRLKEVMLNTVITFGKEDKSGNHKMDLGLFKMWTRNQKYVEVNEFLLPDRFLKTKIDGSLLVLKPLANKIGYDLSDRSKMTPMKNEIKKAIEFGEKVEGAELKEKEILTIK